MDRNNRYVDVDDIWEKGLSGDVKFRTRKESQKVDACSELINTSRIEELYLEAIKAIKKYAREEGRYENDN